MNAAHHSPEKLWVVMLARRDNLSHSVGDPAIGLMFQAVTPRPTKVRRTICPRPVHLQIKLSS
jgi:hypothetical protein